MNPLLKQISDHAADDIPKLIAEGSPKIEAAMSEVFAECLLQETKPKFKFNVLIDADLDNSTFDIKLSWNLRQSLSISHQIEDVNQVRLPLNENN